MVLRTVSAICLRPSGNAQGSFYYYSLVTGRRIHRRRCTTLPMPKEIIDRVHHIARRQKITPGLVFTRIDGTPYGDDDDEVAAGHDDNNPNNEYENTGVDNENNQEEIEEDLDDNVEEFHDVIDEAIDNDNDHAN